MRIAVAGKGGAGKTTICATGARLMARSGVRVVAVDGDTNPNLHAAIGVDAAAVPRSLPPSLVSRRFEGPRLAVTVDEVLRDHAAGAPDGVSLVRMGMPQHADEGCMCSAHATVSALLADLGEAESTVTVLDLEASPEHLSRGTARHADVLLLVVEPYYRSLEAARLQASLAAETSIGRVAVVANKCRQSSDSDAIEEFCARHGLELVGVLPWSEAVMDADAASTPLLDHRPDDGLVAAVGALFGSLVPAVPADASARPFNGGREAAGAPSGSGVTRAEAGV